MTPIETNFMVHAKLIGVEDCPWANLPARAEEFAANPELMIGNYALIVRNVIQDHPERWPMIRSPFLALLKEWPVLRPAYRSAQRVVSKGAATKWSGESGA